jgi:hypothetical protein
MRKLWLGAVATAIVALQPTLALAQRQPGSGKEPASASSPITQTFTTLVLQTIPVSATSAGLPAGVTGTQRCIVGTGTATGSIGVTQGTFEPIRFIGNILCIDPGPNGDFLTFAQNCPAGTTPVIQGVKLIKTEPAIPKCPDVYPGGTFVQTPVSTGIRTWWPLKHTPCETTFELNVEFSCVGPDPRTGVRVVRQVRVNRFIFRVFIDTQTLSWVVHALHNEPLGVCEVPCITDEALFQLLLDQAAAIRTADNLTGNARLTGLNTALDRMEATIVARCLFTLAVWQVTPTGGTPGGPVTVNPCALFPGGGPWGNFTIQDFTWGIVDTLENPCCCKLISDLYWLKLGLIGNDP